VNGLSTEIAGSLVAAGHPSRVASGGGQLQWTTLLWVAGALALAAIVIVIVIVMSRRPRSMEDGMAEFSRRLAAVAPSPAGHGQQEIPAVIPEASLGRRADPAPGVPTRKG
jgi:hypothetical protein